MSAQPAATPQPNDYFAILKARREAITARYCALTPQSQRLAERAQAVIPGGFSRDAVIRAPYSPYLVRGEADHVHDADGRSLGDFWFNATALIAGHAHLAVRAVCREQLDAGTALFSPTESEIRLGELLLARFPPGQRIRFTNSGSEAVMMAIRLARAATSRPTIAKFEGSYHGSYDDIAWSVAPAPGVAGPAATPAMVADGGGLLPSPDRVLVLPYGDLPGTEALIAPRASGIAALLVEPMANRIGLVMPPASFLVGLRELCTRHGIVLIFDEVIAFRLGYHGAQGVAGVMPDLTTLGKIIGGGFPVGAVVGKADILDATISGRPGRVAHSGTFNGNPMTTRAGRATMELLDRDAFAALNAKGAALRARLTEICRGLPLSITGGGSLFKINATSTPITDYRSAATADMEWEALASLELINQGYLMTPRLHGCVSTVTTEDNVEGFLDAVAHIVAA